IYTPDSDTYHSLTILPPFSVESLYKVTGQPLKNHWKPIAVEYYPAVKAGDFPQLASHVPVLTERALEKLRPLIAQYVEILPLIGKSPGMPPLHALNVRSLDCLDAARAEVSYLPDGKPIFVSNYAFRADVLGDIGIFRIKDLELSHCFVSES